MEESSPGVWLGPVGTPMKLVQDGFNYTLTMSAGNKYVFREQVHNGKTLYLIDKIIESQGQVIQMTHNWGLLQKVQEPGGRYLQYHWAPVSHIKEENNLLASVVTEPIEDGWNEVQVTDTNSYRFLRFRGAPGSYSRIAEVEFYEVGSSTPLTGTALGNSPSRQIGKEFGKAHDGDTSTWFEFQSRNWGYTGIDLGAGNGKQIDRIRFYVKAGHAEKMIGGRFEGLNENPASEKWAINKVKTSDGREIQYNYEAVADDVLPTEHVRLTGVTYDDGTQAVYDYNSVFEGTAPIMHAATDPRYSGSSPIIRYEYFNIDNGATGELQKEYGGASNELVATRNATPGNPVISVVYPNGKVEEVTLPGEMLGRFSKIKDGEGNETDYTYTDGGQGFPESMTSPVTGTVSYTRNTEGRLTSKTFPDGTVQSYTYNMDNQLISRTVTGPGITSRTTSYTLDANNRIVRTDYPDGSYETTTYNVFGQVLTHRQKNGGIAVNTYDSQGRKLTFTDAEGHTFNYAYDIHDRLAGVTDPLGRTSSMEYNLRGLVTKTTFADGTFTTQAYDDFGNRIAKTNELGNTWAWTYTDFRQMLTARDPLNRVTTYEYSVGGGGCGGCNTGNNPTKVISPDGDVTVITYDLEWNRTSVTAAFGTPEAATTSYEYDAEYNVVKVTDPLGNFYTNTYDNRNRVVTSADPLSNTTSRTYDAVGNALTITRPDGGVTTTIYDVLNRVVSSTDPKNQTTTFVYDDAGNLTGMTDARGNTHTFEYDLLNRQTKFNYPDSSYEEWTFDSVGNVVLTRNRSGVTQSCTYDLRDRELSCDWSDTTPDLTRTYDAAGRLLTSDNGVSLCSYTYDAANQQLTETTTAAGLGTPYTVSYTYDADGYRSQVTYPGGTVVDYAYTSRNQVASVVADGSPALANYVYDLNGRRVTRTLENGTVANYSYDFANRLLSLDHQKGGVSFKRYDYGYNSVNNRIWMRTDSDKYDVYWYDAIDQVTAVSYGATSAMGNNASRNVTYGLDAVGNRTSVVDNGVAENYGTANNLNQYTVVNGQVLTYDSRGNLTSHSGRSLTYDGRNRLLAVSSVGSNASFAYDNRNRQVSRTVDGVTTYFIWDGWNLIEERDATGNVVTKYVHGVMVDELLLKQDTSAVYYAQDGLGSVTVLTDNTGAVVETVTYDIYGKASFKDSGGVSVSTTQYNNRFLFTGREYIEAVDLYDYRNRYYSASLGRFIQTDPIRFDANDVNLYRYVENSVINYIDPNGTDLVGTVIVITIGVIVFVTVIWHLNECGNMVQEWVEENVVMIRTTIDTVFGTNYSGSNPSP